jgi:microcystin-dependent protein
LSKAHHQAHCDGSLLSISSISQNTALFSLLGTTYGGDGRTTFGLPDLRGRVPVGQGQGRGLSNVDLGEQAGVEAVSLTGQQNGGHSHGVQASATADTKSPGNAVPAYNGAGSAYGQPDGTMMAASMAQPNGQGQPHENRQPYLGACYCIAVEGIYPSRP